MYKNNIEFVNRGIYTLLQKTTKFPQQHININDHIFENISWNVLVLRSIQLFFIRYCNLFEIMFWKLMMCTLFSDVCSNFIILPFTISIFSSHKNYYMNEITSIFSCEKDSPCIVNWVMLHLCIPRFNGKPITRY